MGRTFSFELWRPVRDLFLVKQNLFVNIIIRRRYFQNLDGGLTNIWLVFLFLIESWLNLKYYFGEATLFLKRFHFCISFINFLANICADQVVLKLPNQHYSKIPEQEFESWYTQFLELTTKDKIWYIHDFFKAVGNNAGSSSYLMLLLLAILIFWYFDILTFSLITALAFNKDVSSIRIYTFHTFVISIIFFSVPKPKGDLSDKIFIENQLAIKTNQFTDS